MGAPIDFDKETGHIEPILNALKIGIVAHIDHGITTARMALREAHPEIIVVDNKAVGIKEIFEHKSEEAQQLIKVLTEVHEYPVSDGKSNRRDRRKNQRKNKR